MGNLAFGVWILLLVGCQGLPSKILPGELSGLEMIQLGLTAPVEQVQVCPTKYDEGSRRHVVIGACFQVHCEEFVDAQPPTQIGHQLNMPKKSLRCQRITSE